MSPHREIIPTLVCQAVEAVAGCSVALFGSVAAGEERSESDVDILVLTETNDGVIIPGTTVVHEERDMILLSTSVCGITVYFVCHPYAAMERALDEEPHAMYPFTASKVLHDPSGRAERWLADVRAYFRSHPATVAAWERQLADRQRHRRDPSHPLEHAEWGQFSDYLGEEIRSGRLS